MSLKVHVAYGFHVNCYHSYRGDTNDKQGFGGDIRIIRGIIKTLNEFNNAGIPVKATWDFENAYSLESILPEYAPDIIEDVKNRVEKFGDENIIMGYNNGALSAMTEAELEASIDWAVTNKYGSGLKDVFGKCEMVVRPQEVMFSPTQVPVYNRLGIKALCLYYSYVPFDAFRTIIPQLSDKYAFNPLRFTYKGDSLVIMPTYNNSDLIDAGCLRHLVKDLHKKQESGEIDHDVMIFINMDADSVFWETMLPAPLNRIANTDGIHGLVKEIADLPYVVFDTVGEYLDTHEPLKDITFGEDTADGSFSGYINWSEKPFNRLIWSRIEKARAFSQIYNNENEAPSFEERIRLLSTTHFGLASPVLNVQREKKALALSENMLKTEAAALEKSKKTVILNPSGSAVTSIQVSVDDGFLKNISQLNVQSKQIKSFTATALENYESGCVKTAFLILHFSEKVEKCVLKFLNDSINKSRTTNNEVVTDTAKIKFCEHGKVVSVIYNGKKIAADGFLKSYITYNGKNYSFKPTEVKNLDLGGMGNGISVFGEIHLPNELECGEFKYDFYTDGVSSPVYVNAHVKYPYTKEDTEISTEASALGRKTDVKWTQSVPFQLTPDFTKNVTVIKRNFMEETTIYPVSDFEKSIKENKNLDSFNHHLTAGLVAVTDGEIGLCVVNARQVLGSMAHCPMRLRDHNGKQAVSLNPFGTYYGSQRKYPTRGNSSAAEAFVLVSPQARSIAPSYNGAEETFCLALAPFSGESIDQNTLKVACGFADGCIFVNGENDHVHAFYDDNVSFKAIEKNNITDNQLKSAIVSGTNKNIVSTVKTALKVVFNVVTTQLKSVK